jgi:hypothetical protein
MNSVEEPSRNSDGSYSVPLIGRSQSAIVDEEDLPLISGVRWYLHTAGYAYNRRRGILMHQLIVPCQEIDHKNRNRLDNRRGNLRPCSHAQNLMNRPSAGGTSRHKGVRLFKGKWVAEITALGKREYLGYFRCEGEAAQAYNRAALRLHGEFALLNEDCRP